MTYPLFPHLLLVLFPGYIEPYAQKRTMQAKTVQSSFLSFVLTAMLHKARHHLNTRFRMRSFSQSFCLKVSPDECSPHSSGLPLRRLSLTALSQEKSSRYSLIIIGTMNNSIAYVYSNLTLNFFQAFKNILFFLVILHNSCTAFLCIIT